MVGDFLFTLSMNSCLVYVHRSNHPVSALFFVLFCFVCLEILFDSKKKGGEYIKFEYYISSKIYILWFMAYFSSGRAIQCLL